MALDTLSVDERSRLKELVEKGLKVTQEISDLKEGLRDTIKSIAEELSVKPALLTKAIRIAFKSSIVDEKETVDKVEEILVLTGRI